MMIWISKLKVVLLLIILIIACTCIQAFGQIPMYAKLKESELIYNEKYRIHNVSSVLEVTQESVAGFISTGILTYDNAGYVLTEKYLNLKADTIGKSLEYYYSNNNKHVVVKNNLDQKDTTYIFIFNDKGHAIVCWL